jgi:hypothetical protein
MFPTKKTPAKTGVLNIFDKLFACCAIGPSAVNAQTGSKNL